MTEKAVYYMQEKTHKSEYIMLVNVLSMLAVVYMHVNNCFWTFSTERYWKLADVIESVICGSMFFYDIGCKFDGLQKTLWHKDFFD
jgi:hypothetical protein